MSTDELLIGLVFFLITAVLILTMAVKKKAWHVLEP